MRKSCKSLIIKFATLAVLTLGLANNSHADKTLMWLVDWYQMGNIDTVTVVKSVSIPRWDLATTGYYYGAADQSLLLTSAYTAPIPVHSGYRNDTLPDSLKIPTELNRNWYAIPNFNTSNYQAGRIRISLSYSGQKHMPMLNRPDPKIQVDQYPLGEGQTDQLEPTFVNNCIDSTFGDTVWFWTGALTSAGIQSNASASSIKCLDHNPFMQKVGTVHVLNPWPGKTVWALLGTTWYPLYQEAGRQGWMSTTLWADPRNPLPFKIRLANGDPINATNVQYMDAGGLGGASGALFDFTTNPGGEVWIIPPTTTTTPTVAYTAPSVALSLYIKRPAWSASAVRVIWKGNDSRFVAASTKYCDWFLIQFYKGAVPKNILLSNPIGDTIYGNKGKAGAPALLSSFTDWIDLTGPGTVGGNSYMNTDGNAPVFTTSLPGTATTCDTKILAFSAYDFKGENGPIPRTDPYFYEPFSELGPINNCAESGNKATKGFVNSNLGANGLPVMNSAHNATCGIDTKNPESDPKYWFDTLWRSSAGKISATNSAGSTQLNYFHCVSVPLKLDAVGQYYSFAKEPFWPLDAATSIPATYRNATGNDYKFAMHARSAFEYVPGLKFEFVGDDDVWIFINKKLRLDVGGQHGPNGGIINIDNLGLVEGQSYQFDMFYTERQGNGSSISIKTTMNLVPTIDVLLDSSKSTSSQKVLESWVTETTADASKCPEQGATTNSKQRPGSPSYILVFPDESQVPLDSITILTLLPGATRPGATISGNGSIFKLDTLEVQQSGKLTQSGKYEIRVALGTESKSYVFWNVSKSVEVAGTLFDANGDGHPDSVVLRVANGKPGFKNTTGALIRWADRAGLADSVMVPGSSLNVLPGDSVLTGTLLLPSRTSCPPAGCKTMAGFVYTGPANDPVENPIIDLADGMAPVADSAWMIYDTTKIGKDTLYVRASEDLVAAVSAGLPVGNAAFVQAGRFTAPRPIAGTAILVGNLLKLPFDPANNPILPGDSIRLGGFSGDSSVNLPGTFSKWVPLKAEPFARSWMLDMNGDGYPDSISLETKGSLASAVSATVHWKTGAGLDTSFVVATPGGIGTGIKLPVGVLRDGTFCAGCALEVMTGTDTKRFALLDSVPPVAVTASLVFGLEVSDADTVMIQASEVLAKLASGTFAFLGKDSASAMPTLLTTVNSNPSISGSGNVLKLAVPSGAIANDIAWVRLGTAISDGHKLVGDSSRWVKLTLKPSGRAYLFDANGDGAADSMSVYVRGGVQATEAVLTWKKVTGEPDTRTWKMDPATGPFSVQAPGISQAFDRGATSCSSGCTVSFKDASGTTLVWPLIDMVAPMAKLGTYRFGLTQDTLTVTFSEDLKSIAASQPWLEWGKTTVGGSILHSSVELKGSSAIFYLAPANGAVDGWDSLRLAAGPKSGNVSDLGGKTVGATSPWANIVYGIAPFQAYLLDPWGAGRGTNVRVTLTRKVPQAAVTAIGSFQFSWTDSAMTGMESRTAKVSDLVWDGVASWTGALSKAFALGQTACTGACSATATALDNSTRATTLLDSIPPSAVKARYRYSQPDLALDTLELELSEPWEGEHPGNVVDPFAVVGHSGDSIEVRNFATWELIGNKILRVIVPASFQKNLEVGDSARLAYLPQGSRIWDASKNKVGVRSRWVPIDFGLRPPKLEIEPYRQILSNTSVAPWDLPPATNPQMEMVLVNPKDQSLEKIGADGVVSGAPINDIDHTLGIEIRINRPLEGMLIIYDNIGTAVVSLDLTPMKALWVGQEDRERVIRVAWNGTGPDHKFAATGIYLYRVVVKYEDKEGNKEFRNIVWKLGFHRDTK